MANDPNPLESRLEHRRGRRQPVENESSLIIPTTVQPPQAEQEVSSAAQNIPAETSQPAEPSKGGRVKSRANKGCARSKRAREKSETPSRGERMSPDQSLCSRLIDI